MKTKQICTMIMIQIHFLQVKNVRHLFLLVIQRQNRDIDHLVSYLENSISHDLIMASNFFLEVTKC